jgi:hypothetical protein
MPHHAVLTSLQLVPHSVHTASGTLGSEHLPVISESHKRSNQFNLEFKYCRERSRSPNRNRIRSPLYTGSLSTGTACMHTFSLLGIKLAHLVRNESCRKHREAEEPERKPKQNADIAPAIVVLQPCAETTQQATNTHVRRETDGGCAHRRTS